MFLVSLLATAATMPLAAQFGNVQGLAVNHDASVIYFTAPLRLRGSGHPSLFNTYRFDGSFRLIASSEPRSYAAFTSISDDGAVEASNFSRPCEGLAATVTSCSNPDRFRAVVKPRGGASMPASSHARVDRSGRFAVIGAPYLAATVAPDPRHELARVDLQTGVSTPLGGHAPGNSRHWITSDGSVLVQEPYAYRWTLVSLSGQRTAMGPSGSDPVLAYDGTYLLYLDGSGDLRMRLRDGSDRLFQQSASLPSIAADSRRILFIRAVQGVRQAFYTGPDQTTPRQITSEPEGISESAISGDGNWAVAATENGRLIKLNLRTGERTQLLDRNYRAVAYSFSRATSSFDPAVLTPGSVHRLEGLPGGGPSPLEIFVGSHRAPILSQTAQEILFQTPWEAEPAPASDVSIRWGDPLWESADLVTLCRACPSLVTAPIHEDFHGFVTQADRAQPGELIHFYATGLGPVSPPIATGEAPISGTPHTVAAGCTATTDAAEIVEVLFAGLAPPYVGYYVVTLRVPSATSGEFRLRLQCGGSEEQALGIVPVR